MQRYKTVNKKKKSKKKGFKSDDCWAIGASMTQGLAIGASQPNAPVGGNAGIMTTNTGYWGPTF